jgi:glycine oxidase
MHRAASDAAPMTASPRFPLASPPGSPTGGGTPMRIGIAGAGLLGRLVAWTLAQQGHHVSVFDPAPGPQPAHDGHGAAGFTAAGMLSPLAELETADADVAGRGWHSIRRWDAITRALASRLHSPPYFSRQGSLMVAHGSDLGAARRVLARVGQAGMDATRAGDGASDMAVLQQTPLPLDAQALHALEPSLHGALGPLHAWLLPGEAHIDTVRTLQCLLEDAPTVDWHWASPARRVGAHEIDVPCPVNTCHARFDWVFDLRGVGARPDMPVRGVRGELVWLHAPGLNLRRPVRLLHPRHRVYIVPRPGDMVIVGASEIESEDRSPVSLRSAVELMAAAHSVMPGLAEARIVRMDSNLRPALPDHRPMLHIEPGLVRINGLYRHGWLLAPSLVDEALSRIGLMQEAAAPWQSSADTVFPSPT